MHDAVALVPHRCPGAALRHRDPVRHDSPEHLAAPSVRRVTARLRDALLAAALALGCAGVLGVLALLFE